MTEATRLLREARPRDVDSAPDGALLDRILSAPCPPDDRRPPRRRRTRLIVAAGATALVLTALVAALPSTRDHGPLDRAVAALTKPDTLLHFRVRMSRYDSVTNDPARRWSGREELWQTTDGRRRRALAGDMEIVQDLDKGRLAIYSRRAHQVSVFPLSGRMAADGPLTIADPPTGGPPTATAGDLPALLTAARRGDRDDVTLVGRDEIRGVEVDHLRLMGNGVIDRRAPRPGAPSSKRRVDVVRDIYLNARTGLPVRVVERLTPAVADVPTFQIDYLLAEQIPREAGTERLLQMSPHPGAKIRRLNG